MNIYIVTIPHARQAYDTVGNWTFRHAPDDPHAHEFLEIAVSDLGNEDFEFLVALHEMVEAWLCRKRGISGEAVTAFDEQFEAERQQLLAVLHGDAGELSGPEQMAEIMIAEAAEPGDDPRACYHSEHIFATNIERRLAEELGVDWGAYERAIAEAK